MLRDPKAAMRDSLNDAEPVKPEPPRPLMRALPPADPFPIEALGDVLAPAARAIHDCVQAPMAICAQSVLAVSTLAVQGHADVQLPTGHIRPLNGFYLSVAATGERKTAVDDHALSPVREREAALRQKYDAERNDYDNAHLAWEKARDAAVKRGKGNRAQIKAAVDDVGLPPVPPLEPLLTCPEPTYEGLCKSFAVGSPSLGIFASEGGQFIGGHGMTDDAKLRTAAGLSAAWDGQPIKRVRADGAMVLPGRRLAMHLMAQPDVAGLMLNDPLLAEQGLLSRVLATAPDAASGTRLWHDPSPKTRNILDGYSARMLGILQRPLPVVTGTRNTLAPSALRLSNDAKRLFVAFHDHVEKRVGAGGELEPIRGLANKLPEHAARIAAVLAMVSDFDAGEVAAIQMTAGIDLAQHYATEALRLFGASSVNAKIHDAQRLLDWLLKAWSGSMVSLPDIYQRGPNFIRDAATARQSVQVLVDHGWLIPVTVAVGGRTRREVWRIVRG
jgi:hypothetical protein